MAGESNTPSMNWNACDLDKEWKRFKQHCQFTFLGPLHQKNELQKVNYLMTYIGDKGREIYQTFTWAAVVQGQPEEYETIIGVTAKYDLYVAPKKNQIRSTVIFNRRRQEQSERFDNFVTDLKLLVRECGYTEPDRMLRDAIVLRAVHDTVREKCLEIGDELTLDRAIQIGQNYETSILSMATIGDEDPRVNKVSMGRGTGKYKHGKPRKSDKQDKDESEELCSRCGYDISHTKCPAKSSQCNKCKKYGHFAKVCKSKVETVDNVASSEEDIIEKYYIVDDPETDDSSDEYSHLIHAVGPSRQKKWWVDLKVNGKSIGVQIDTGADRSLLPFDIFKDMGLKLPLVKSDRSFKSYTLHELDVEGIVSLPVTYKDRTVDVKFYVVHLDQKTLISGYESEQLGLIQRTYTINEEIDEYPELESTTGAREALFWPGMNSQIEDLVNDCTKCSEYQNKQRSETLQPTKVPAYPWCEIASDIFDFEGSHYLLTVDYFSKYMEVDKLPSMSSTSTIETLKSQVCRHGIPERLRTDNGPQFSSREFSVFCEDYGIQHVTSSPNYPQSNGEAERAIQTVKKLWAKTADKQLSLLDYRSTPLEACDLSPAQLSMGRRPRNKVPASRELLKVNGYNHKKVAKQLEGEKLRQTHYYNQKNSMDFHPLSPGDPVRMAPLPGTTNWLPAKVVAKHATPRSYIVQCNNRKYRRNRRHLRLATHKANEQATTKADSLPDPTVKPPVPMLKINVPARLPEKPPAEPPVDSSTQQPRVEPPETVESNTPTVTPYVVTRSGRVSKPPQRMDV